MAAWTKMSSYGVRGIYQALHDPIARHRPVESFENRVHPTRLSSASAPSGSLLAQGRQPLLATPPGNHR